MRHLRPYILLLPVWLVVMLSSCTAPLLPAPNLPQESRRQISDEDLLVTLRSEWQALQQVHMDHEARQELMDRYNAHLLTLLRRVRHDMFRRYGKGRKEFPAIFEVVHDGLPASRSLNDVYRDIVPAADVDTQSLEEHFGVPGIGVPLVGVIPAAKIHPGDELVHFKAQGTVATLTALLEFPKDGGRPTLRLIPRHWQERVRIGRLSYPLAGDFSAPIEIYWNLTDIKSGRFLGLLNPQKLRDTTGLTCMERYNPHKIPVILTHGLASSAATFNNLVNRLLKDPNIRNHYQFWYFNYPTGVAWTHSAQVYRQALQQVRRHFDPHHTNRNWDRMVVVGHSMGGLITRHSQSVPSAMKQHRLPLLNECDMLPPEALRRQVYDVKPVRAARVVYMATPHRGAPIANNRIVLFLTRLVRLPETLVDEVISIATLQEDNALTNPRHFTEWFTSVGQLSPRSYSIRALSQMPVRNVPTHSIIGDRGRNNSPYSSDGIVPYWSSHLPWGTESIVPTSHSVQDAPETAEQLRRILNTHLEELAGRDIHH